MTDKLDFDIQEGTAEVASVYKCKLMNGESSKENLNAYSECVRMLNDMDERGSDDHIAEREAKARKAEAEARKAEAEAKMAEIDLANKPMNDKIKTATDIAETAAPYVAAAATTGTAIYSLNKRWNIAERSIKLVTSIEHLGYIPAITTKKVIDSIFSGIFKG